ncbi:MAG: hypothetical protein HOA39_08680 [Gammaproteobacteria bacterium]|nr:hypothetical protein [Gammaproteobacteria bacterium]
MSGREQVLTEIGIERWRLRGVARPTVESETHSSHLVNPQPPIDPPAMATGPAETRIDWQVLIRNYRTVATLQLSKARLDADLTSQLNQLSDDIGLAINGLATKPLLQSQLFSTSGEQVLDATKAATWIADLPTTVLALTGQCPELIALIERVFSERGERRNWVLQVPDLLAPATAAERKARLWQQLSTQGA